MFLLSSDADALTGFRLAGIPGKTVGDAAELESALKAAAVDNEIAILLVTGELFDLYGERLNSFRKGAPFLVSQIPRSNGSTGADGITRYIQEAVGIKV